MKTLGESLDIPYGGSVANERAAPLQKIRPVSSIMLTFLHTNGRAVYVACSDEPIAEAHYVGRYLSIDSVFTVSSRGLIQRMHAVSGITASGSCLPVRLATFTSTKLQHAGVSGA